MPPAGPAVTTGEFTSAASDTPQQLYALWDGADLVPVVSIVVVVPSGRVTSIFNPGRLVFSHVIRDWARIAPAAPGAENSTRSWTKPSFPGSGWLASDVHSGAGNLLLPQPVVKVARYGDVLVVVRLLADVEADDDLHEGGNPLGVDHTEGFVHDQYGCAVTSGTEPSSI
jgi:hypothetical protein